MTEFTERLKIFERSYQEVLTALKHQDDKLNRILTALAFLTVAGVGLFSRITGPSDGLALGGSGPSAPVVFFVVFLIAVAIGVIVTLTAIGPGSPLHQASTPEDQANFSKSLIFYARIARNKKWDETFDKPPDDLEEQLAQNYHREAQKIAFRVNYKVIRAREAGAWVQLAIVALALMGIFSAIGLSADARWWVALGLLVAVLAIPLWDLVMMVDARYLESYSAAAYVMLAAAAAIAASFLVVGELANVKWEALAYAGVVFIVPRYAIVRPKQTYGLMAVALLAAIPTLLLIIF